MRMLKIFGVSRCPVSGDNTQPHLGQSRVVVKEEGGHKSRVQVVYSTGVRGWGVVKREGADYLCWEEHDWRRLSPRLIGHPHSNTCYTSTTWMSPPSLVWWVTLHPTHTHTVAIYIIITAPMAMTQDVMHLDEISVRVGWRKILANGHFLKCNITTLPHLLYLKFVLDIEKPSKFNKPNEKRLDFSNVIPVNSVYCVHWHIWLICIFSRNSLIEDLPPSPPALNRHCFDNNHYLLSKQQSPNNNHCCPNNNLQQQSLLSKQQSLLSKQ